MRDSIVAVIGTTAVAVLIAITIALSIGVDNVAPVISFENEISYDDKQPISALLAGVVAKDNRDGDVTGSVMVESLIVLDDGSQAKVTYVAKDSSNNIAKESRLVAYSGSGVSIYASSTGIIDNEALSSQVVTTEAPTTEAPTTTAAEETTPEETTTAEPETTTAEPTQASTERPTHNGSESPALTLRATEGSISTGGFFNVANYVANITDNTDSRETLYRRIGIEGTYDSYTPGDYNFYVYCIDSDGNRSNMEIFTLHVTN